MYLLKNIYHQEPVVLAATLRVVLLTAATFGAELSAEQIAGLVITTEAVLALFTRGKVSPNNSSPNDLDG
jgi:hypothetical protein